MNNPPLTGLDHVLVTPLAEAQGLADLIGERGGALGARRHAVAGRGRGVPRARACSGSWSRRSSAGEEADLPTVLEVYEEVCRADGSAGWTLLANATTSAFAGAYTGPDRGRRDVRRRAHPGGRGTVLAARHRGARR